MQCLYQGQEATDIFSWWCADAVKPPGGGGGGVHKIFDFDFGSFNHLEIKFKSHKMIAELHFTPGEKTYYGNSKR